MTQTITTQTQLTYEEFVKTYDTGMTEDEFAAYREFQETYDITPSEFESIIEAIMEENEIGKEVSGKYIIMPDDLVLRYESTLLDNHSDDAIESYCIFSHKKSNFRLLVDYHFIVNQDSEYIYDIQEYSYTFSDLTPIHYLNEDGTTSTILCPIDNESICPIDNLYIAPNVEDEYDRLFNSIEFVHSEEYKNIRLLLEKRNII